MVNYFDNRYIRRLAIMAKSEKGTACCYAVIVLLFLSLAHAVVLRHVKLAAWLINPRIAGGKNVITWI